ncbi:carbohydrate kinase [Maribacter sp. ANRC-HE7]|uniref:Carbohydrate kinase n=1 Tax=Maribacter aquimaris TaxID=2737171 RepID=A0ABR7UVD9_9FLAO|nr:carbohydrate kinase [Maribacter aquimaris]MBD0776397.1 carbohydrate kinase [Maribacter aquimaris]
MKNIVCFGEVLWDVFPSHKTIGGAPLNVALRLQSLGNTVSIITRIGDDAPGKEIVAFAAKHGVNVDYIQVDTTLGTGAVKVTLNEKGSASYDINFPRAWDNIQFTEQAKKKVQDSDAFIFGSLVARSETSRDTLYGLLKLAKYKILDINLRKPHYTLEVLTYLMKQADFLKFNDDEIFEIASALGATSKSMENIVLFMAEHTHSKSICVTKGRHGALLYHNDTFYYNSGYKIIVSDTVGAGDSFLAALTDKLLKGTPPQKAIDFASAVGAIVASKQGANPKIENQEIEGFIQ